MGSGIGKTPMILDRMQGAPGRALRSVAASGLLAALVLSTGCGQQARGTQPDPQVAQGAPTALASAPAPTEAGPPPPVPATFDVASLAERVQPLVVNIVTQQRVRGPEAGPDGGDPFDFFFGPGA